MATTDYRHQARSITLQALYELDCTDHGMGTVLAERLESEQALEQTHAFAQRLVQGVRQHQPAIDDLIRRYAPEWPLEQIAIIDRNILRIAVFELVIEASIPVKVAINEAIELAKTFGSESTPRFVNGVLGTLAAREGDRRTQTDSSVTSEDTN